MADDKERMTYSFISDQEFFERLVNTEGRKENIRHLEAAWQGQADFWYYSYAQLSNDSVHVSLASLSRHLHNQDVLGYRSDTVFAVSVLPDEDREEEFETLSLLAKSLFFVCECAEEIICGSEVETSFPELYEEFNALADLEEAIYDAEVLRITPPSKPKIEDGRRARKKKKRARSLKKRAQLKKRKRRPAPPVNRRDTRRKLRPKK